MKAMLLRGYGGVDQLQAAEIAAPSPARGEVLVKIEASAVNPFDLMIREGLFTHIIPLDLPAVLGADAAGTIVALGEGVTTFHVGDRVIADFRPNGRGSHAEYGALPEMAVALLPEELSFEQGATLPKAGLMGHQVVDALPIGRGDRVIVSGALGPVGRVAVQRLHAIGAIPVAAVRGERLDEALVIAVEAVDIGAAPGEPLFDYAISAAIPVADHLFGHVRSGGAVASIVPVPDEARSRDDIVIHDLFHQTEAATLAAVAEAAAAGELSIPIAHTLPLADLDAAHALVAAGARGKVVLRH